MHAETIIYTKKYKLIWILNISLIWPLEDAVKQKAPDFSPIVIVLLPKLQVFISALIQFSNLDIMGLHDIMFHSNMKIFEVNITFLYCDAFNIETLCKAVAWRERARARPETIFSGSSSRDISLHKRVGVILYLPNLF